MYMCRWMHDHGFTVLQFRGISVKVKLGASLAVRTPVL